MDVYSIRKKRISHAFHIYSEGSIQWAFHFHMISCNCSFSIWLLNFKGLCCPLFQQSFCKDSTRESRALQKPTETPLSSPRNSILLSHSPLERERFFPILKRMMSYLLTYEMRHWGARASSGRERALSTSSLVYEPALGSWVPELDAAESMPEGSIWFPKKDVGVPSESIVRIALRARAVAKARPPDPPTFAINRDRALA